MRSEDQPCAYESCKVPTTEKEDQYCQFHRRENPLPADQYLSVFTHYLNAGANDFRGFVFPPDITIKNLSFPRGACFGDAVFTGNITIHDCSIRGDADFQRAKFEGVSKFVRLNLVDNKAKGDASTYLPLNLKFLAAIFHKGAMFSGMKQVNSIQLDHATLNGYVSFNDVETLGGIFLNNMRSEEGISFGNCICCKEFHCSEVHLKKDLKFMSCKINAAFSFRDTTCEGALIIDKSELPNNVGFEVINSSLGDGVEVSNCTINRRLHFENLKFGDHASVRIIEPTLEVVNTTSKTGSFIFSGMTFPEYRTTFKGFKSCKAMTLPLLRIDHCNLSKAYFDECDFSSISLYTSDYDNAVFLNCDWPSLKSPKRDNAIYEDLYIHSNEIKEAHGPAQRNDSLKDLSHMEVSSMYNRFKNAFDGLKRYETSGDFFYNEMELKREHYWKTNKTNGLLYTFFKLLSWYGQKPRRCACCLFLLIASFTTYTLKTGLEVKVGETSELIQYSFQPQAYDFFWSGEYWTDLSLSLRYSVERIVPFKLMEFSDQKLYSASKAAYNFPVTIGYTVTSILYIYFMIAGLRRHFKRF